MKNIEDCWYRISVKALIFNEKGEFLLHEERNGNWDLPGGGLNHGEDPIKCLKRELDEEMGLQVVEIYPVPRFFFTSHKPKSNTRPWIANICYEVKVRDLNFKPSNECVGIQFFSPEAVKDIKAIENVKDLAKQMMNLSRF